jgi:hypothetical protein
MLRKVINFFGKLLLVVAVFMTGVAAIALFESVMNVHQPTPLERELQQKAASGDVSAKHDLQELKAQIDAQRTQFCHLKAICKTFATARQECATAGNFNTCMNIKMGESDYALIGSCTDDGAIAFPPDEMPRALECWFR